MNAIYLHDWAEPRWEGGSFGEPALLSDFDIEKAALDGAEIIVASYTYEDYSGDAYVLFRKDGKLFEVHGSHCSCYGLEGQWVPEETTEEAIRHRIEKGRWGSDNQFINAVTAALNGGPETVAEQAAKLVA